VRLPLDYRIWTESDNPYRLKEAELREIDRAVQFGEKYGIHVMLNFHRAPGYTVASPPEPLNLWKDEEAQRLCIHHWTQFAKRYKGKPNRQLSFNLFNEPANVDAESHRKVVARVVEAIRDGRRRPPDCLRRARLGYDAERRPHPAAGRAGDAWLPALPPNPLPRRMDTRR
jgi:endoglucanase